MTASTDNAPPGPPDELDELEASLKRLAMLHVKVREMRTAIPRLVESLGQQHEGFESRYGPFVASMGAVKAEVAEIKELLRSEETAKVFERADRSRKLDPKGIKAWQHKDHPDWTKP